MEEKANIESPSDFWRVSAENLLNQLETNVRGLMDEEARDRYRRYGAHRLRTSNNNSLFLFLAQFKSPIILILLLATGLSFFLHDHINALIILGIVFISGLLGFWQEKTAADAVNKLLNSVKTKAEVLRDNRSVEVFAENVVVGDIVVFNAGDVVPADCRILESKDLFIDEATLTGETYPVEKFPGVIPAETPLAKRTNVLWMGTHVVSGTAKAVAFATGMNTKFGEVSQRLKLRPPETEFERGVRDFGLFLMEVTLLLVIVIFAINVYLNRPTVDAFLFSLALAVGLTPQLLPAIVSINLAHGAKRMAQRQVIVKKLISIENFGSMNILCSDKTGTLTQGTVSLQSALDVSGQVNEKVHLYAYLNAYYETGFCNPIDEAIKFGRSFDVTGYLKLDEIPYDFSRKRLSILVSTCQESLMITKGALVDILECCSSAEIADRKEVSMAAVREEILNRRNEFSRQGFRTIGIAYKKIGGRTIQRVDEHGMTFLGFLVLADPLKPDILATIDSLKKMGIGLKIITGDNRTVASAIGRQIGLSSPLVLSGLEVQQMGDAALVKQVGSVDIFSEIEPNQKERIIVAFKKAGNVVGYIGDGINDVSALHAADVGISVDAAVDVAKEAADIVLLEHDLNILVEGVQEGRVAFANTLKYMLMATSANFGNMFSIAGASLFLSFLPLLPKQVLLTNFLTDIPEMAIATDRVDAESIDRPRRLNISLIRKFMTVFGMISSVFDGLTFAVLLFILHATQDQFRTAWFIESVISATMIVLVIRTPRPFFKSLPGRNLFLTTLAIIILTLLLPMTPIAPILDFTKLPVIFFVFIGIIVAIYVLTAETVKGLFYKTVKF